MNNKTLITIAICSLLISVTLGARSFVMNRQLSTVVREGENTDAAHTFLELLSLGNHEAFATLEDKVSSRVYATYKPLNSDFTGKQPYPYIYQQKLNVDEHGNESLWVMYDTNIGPGPNINQMTFKFGHSGYIESVKGSSMWMKGGAE